MCCAQEAEDSHRMVDVIHGEREACNSKVVCTWGQDIHRLCHEDLPGDDFGVASWVTLSRKAGQERKFRLLSLMHLILKANSMFYIAISTPLVYMLSMWGSLSNSVKWCHWINKIVVRKRGGRKVFQQQALSAGAEEGRPVQCRFYCSQPEGCVSQSTHTRYFISQLPCDPPKLLPAQAQIILISGKNGMLSYP